MGQAQRAAPITTHSEPPAAPTPPPPYQAVVPAPPPVAGATGSSAANPVQQNSHSARPALPSYSSVEQMVGAPGGGAGPAAAAGRVVVPRPVTSADPAEVRRQAPRASSSGVSDHAASGSQVDVLHMAMHAPGLFDDTGNGDRDDDPGDEPAWLQGILNSTGGLGLDGDEPDAAGVEAPRAPVGSTNPFDDDDDDDDDGGGQSNGAECVAASPAGNPFAGDTDDESAHGPDWDGQL